MIPLLYRLSYTADPKIGLFMTVWISNVKLLGIEGFI